MIDTDHMIKLDPEILQVVGILSRLGSGSCLVLLDEEVYRDLFIFSYSSYAARSGDAFIVSVVLVSTKQVRVVLAA